MRRAGGIALTLVLLAGCHDAHPRSAGSGTDRTSPALASPSGRTTSPGTASANATASTGTASSPGSTAPGRAGSSVSASAAPTKNPDEIIVGTPSSVTLEALLPVAPGKQRWSDQTFVVTGARAQRLVAELKSMRVDTGPPPAGCQPWGRRTTIRVASGNRRLSFLSYCDLIFAGDLGGRDLQSVALVRDVDATMARRRPTRIVAPKADQTLQVGLVVVPTKRNEPVRKAPGTIRVTQDGRLIGSKHIRAGGQFTMKVAPGVYALSSTVTGLDCGSSPITVVVAYGGVSTQLPCYAH